MLERWSLKPRRRGLESLHGHQFGRQNTNGAGLFSICAGKVHIHFFPQAGHRMWGRPTEEYDCYIKYFDLSPALLICW